MSVTLIHTADWQLGKQFGNVPGDPGALLRSQRIETVNKIAQLAQVRQAAAILVCGDAFDSNTVADATLRQMLNATALFSGDWVFIPGNHDPARAASVWTRAEGLLQDQDDARANVHFLVRPKEPLILQNGALAILPAVLERKHEAGDPTAWFDQAATPEGAIRIGMAHGSVPDSLPPEEMHNPIAADRAETAQLDYLALGDWHGTRRINDRTWYAGTPEPDRFTSSDPGNVLVVEIEQAGAAPAVEKVPIGKYVWKVADHSIRNEADLDALTQQINQLGPDFGNVLLRLKLAGVVNLELHAKLDKWIARWGARLHHLEVDEKELLAEPTEDDLDQIASRGFIRTASDRLRTLTSDLNKSEREREIANAALMRLYQLRVSG